MSVLKDVENLPRRVNIGCGFDKRASYLNVDVDPACNPDVLVPDHNLSILPDRFFEEVRAWDVLEHIPHAHTMHALLDWAALLKRGGTLVLQTSSMFGVVDAMRGSPSFETEYNWTRCMFGNQAHAGDFHYCGFTERTLKVLLNAAGFQVPFFSLVDGWLLACKASKVEDWTELLTLDDSKMFAVAYENYLERPLPDDALHAYRLQLQAGAARRALLRDIIAAPEHLYKRGAALDRGREAPVQALA